jgi:hypothetical protein
MRALVCFVPYRLKVQNFAHLQVVSLLVGDVGCYRINLSQTYHQYAPALSDLKRYTEASPRSFVSTRFCSGFSKTINAISP